MVMLDAVLLSFGGGFVALLVAITGIVRVIRSDLDTVAVKKLDFSNEVLVEA